MVLLSQLIRTAALTGDADRLQTLEDLRRRGVVTDAELERRTGV